MNINLKLFSVYVGVIPVLALNFTSYTPGGSNGTFIKYAPLFSVSLNIITYRYIVKIGDKAHPLGTPMGFTVPLLYGTILSLSDYPLTLANLTHIDVPLSSSNVIINAMGSPSLMRISSDHLPGIYSTGEYILIYLEFQSPITITPYTSPPVVFFQAPIEARMIYQTGSGTEILTFSYTVLSGQMANPLSFNSGEFFYVISSVIYFS
jgi:hypothetical protein